MVLKIVSFLPSATEMIYALGLNEQLMAVTHECDFPPEALTKAVVVVSALSVEDLSPPEIDRVVSERLQRGESLYYVDETLLRTIAPDLILTQDLCQVCAPYGNQVSEIIDRLSTKPNILSLSPKSIADIFDNIRTIAVHTGAEPKAAEIIASSLARLEKIALDTKKTSSRPRVFCMEWINPVFCAGHWVPEMVKIAGGEDKIGREGRESIRIPWEDVLEWDPEIFIIMPCGFDLNRARYGAQTLSSYPGWFDLSAVRNKRVFVVDANAYYARPGPRVVEGTELLAHLIHPEVCDWEGQENAFFCLEY